MFHNRKGLIALVVLFFVGLPACQEASAPGSPELQISATMG